MRILLIIILVVALFAIRTAIGEGSPPLGGILFWVGVGLLFHEVVIRRKDGKRL